MIKCAEGSGWAGPLLEEGVDAYPLAQKIFADNERILLTAAGMTVSLFRYSSGVEAVRVSAAKWELVWLPFLGQQVWSFTIEGRPLTMSTPVKEPIVSPSYMANYGAFLLHCGVTAMGNPAPEDQHPLHGELPAASYQQAWLELNEGRLTLAGTFQHRAVAAASYNFSPRITLEPSHSWMEVDARLLNTGNRSMDYAYLAHLNFLPEYGDQIFSTAALTPSNLTIRKNSYADAGLQQRYQIFREEVLQQPQLLSLLTPQHIYDPELVLWFKEDRADSSGWCHSCLRKKDGRGYFVSYQRATLDHNVRWVRMEPDMQAIGMVLPATAAPEGMTRERAKGNIKTLTAGSECRFRYHAGELEPSQQAELEKHITSVNVCA